MALQFKRGTNLVRQQTELAAGEPFYVTDHATANVGPFWIGDGTTVGGVMVTPGSKELLNDLSDVYVRAPENNQLFVWDTTSSRWINKNNVEVPGWVIIKNKADQSTSASVSTGLTVRHTNQSSFGVIAFSTGSTTTLTAATTLTGTIPTGTQITLSDVSGIANLNTGIYYTFGFNSLSRTFNIASSLANATAGISVATSGSWTGTTCTATVFNQTGIGTGIELTTSNFGYQDILGAKLESISTSITSGSETFDFNLRLRKQGTLTKVFTVKSDGTAEVGALTSTGNTSIGGNATITGNATINGNTTLGDSISDSITLNGLVSSFKLADNASITGTMATTDKWKISGSGTSDAGELEIATQGDGNEPIYIRQYSGDGTTINRTATILDSSGRSRLSRLGLGIDAAYNLHVYDANTAQIGLVNSERSLIITNNTSDDLLSFNYGGANRLQFDTSNQWFNTGYTGFGTTTPTATVDVNGTLRTQNLNVISSTTFSGDLEVNGGDITTTYPIANIFNNTGIGTVNLGNGATTEVNIGGTGTPRVQIKSNTIVGASATQDVFNTVATTVNAFGAANNLFIGNENSVIRLYGKISTLKAGGTTVDQLTSNNGAYITNETETGTLVVGHDIYSGGLLVTPKGHASIKAASASFEGKDNFVPLIVIDNPNPTPDDYLPGNPVTIVSADNVSKVLVSVYGVEESTKRHCAEVLVMKTSSTNAMHTVYGEMYSENAMVSFSTNGSGNLVITPLLAINMYINYTLVSI